MQLEIMKLFIRPNIPWGPKTPVWANNFIIGLFYHGSKIVSLSLFFSLTLFTVEQRIFFLVQVKGKIDFSQNFTSEPTFLFWYFFTLLGTNLLLPSWKINDVLTSLLDELISAKVAMTENN